VTEFVLKCWQKYYLDSHIICWHRKNENIVCTKVGFIKFFYSYSPVTTLNIIKILHVNRSTVNTNNFFLSTFSLALILSRTNIIGRGGSKRRKKIIRATEDRKATLPPKRGKESIGLIWLRLRLPLDSYSCTHVYILHTYV